MHLPIFSAGLIFVAETFLGWELSAIAITGTVYDKAKDAIITNDRNLFINLFSKYLIFYNNNVSIVMLQMQHVVKTTYFIQRIYKIKSFMRN